MPTFVFLDTQAFEAESFNTQSTHFETLAKHLKSGRLKLVATDITRTEVHGRIDSVCKEEIASLRKIKQKSRVLRSAHKIQELGLFCDLHLDSAQMNLHRAVDRFLDEHDATVIEAMAQNSKLVFKRYFAIEPPFAPGSKRKEFPDAFVIEALIDWISRQDGELFVVSGDAPFREACDEDERIKAFKDVALLLNHVASDDENLADFLRDQITGCLSQIENTAKQEFEGLGFHIDDEWGDVELKVTGMDLVWEPELIYIKESEVIAELGFDAQYEVRLSYDDSSTGTYDREEESRIFMDHVIETVRGSAHLVITVTATFDRTDADGFEIQSIELTEPTGGFGIPTSKMEDY